MAKRLTYTAVCLVCYTSTLAAKVGKRHAERACTSHLTAYGHRVTILPDQPEVK